MKRLAVAITFALACTGAFAGAWGDGSFENDDAMDWVGDCVQAASPGVVKAAFDRVLNADVAEAPDASAAIAAAEVVAASLGKPSAALPENLKAWLAGQPRAQIAAQAALAERALTKIEDARHSELRQLWSEGKANQWLTKVQALQSRIGSKLAARGHKPLLANDRLEVEENRASPVGSTTDIRNPTHEPRSGCLAVMLSSAWSGFATASGMEVFQDHR